MTTRKSFTEEFKREAVRLAIERGNIKARIIAISNNGGTTWDTTYYDRHLPDPVCQGSILTVGEKNGNTIIAVCNNADTLKRDVLTLRISYDDGKNFKTNIIVDKSTAGYKGDYTAYSDMVKLNKKEVGVLYEYDNYKAIIFSPVAF